MRHCGKRRKRVSLAAPARGPQTKRTGADSRRGQSPGSEAQAGIRSAARSPRPPGPPGCPPVLPTRLAASSARSRSGLTTKMAARPAPDKDARPPSAAARNEKTIYPSLSLCCFLAYITINARLCVCVSGRGRAAARRAGGSARGRRAGSGQPRHQNSARPRRLAAPPRYWRPRSRAISLRLYRLGSAEAAAPTTPRQRELGGGGERPCSGPAQTASTSSTFPSSGSATACPPPPAAAARSLKLAASCRCRCYRRRRSTNYIRATRPWPPSEKLGSFRHTPPSYPPHAA